jgi:hypothetical protein
MLHLRSFVPRVGLAILGMANNNGSETKIAWWLQDLSLTSPTSPISGWTRNSLRIETAPGKLVFLDIPQHTLW